MGNHFYDFLFISICGEALQKCGLPISEIIHFAPLATPLFSLKRHSHWRSTLKEQILSFKNEPSFGRDKLCREANKEPQTSFLIVEMEEKNMVIYNTLSLG